MAGRKSAAAGGDRTGPLAARRRSTEPDGILPCSRCQVAARCLPGSVPEGQIVQVESMVTQQRVLRAGAVLFRAGEEFSSLFAVRSGCLKSTVIDVDGREHILNFHLPGEVLGFASIYQRRHAGNAIALTTSTVCYLSFSEVLRLSQQFPELILGLLRIASRSALYTGRLTGDHNAVVRVAAFLKSLSGRLRAQGRQSSEFSLVMSREDIANHLRLAPETVSRVLTQLRQQGVISARGKAVRLLDEERLQDLAGPMLPYG